MTERVCEIIGQGPFIASTSARWQGSTLADEPVGSDSMTRIVICAFRPGIFTTLTAQTLWSHGSNASTTGGWAIAGLGSGLNQIRWVFARTPPNASTAVDTPANLFRSPVLIVIATFDLSLQLAAIRLNGTNVTAAAATAYRGPSEMVQIGSRPVSNDNQCRDGSICACIGSDSEAIALADLPDLEADLRERVANGRTFEGILSNDIVYDARDAAGSLTWVPRGTASAPTLTRQGTIGVTATQGRVITPL